MSNTTTETVNEIELAPIPLASTNPEVTASAAKPKDDQHDYQSLPPADHGLAAWRLLMAVFVFEALLWGFPLSFGVFQAYYSRQPEFENSPYVSIVGSVASGIVYLASPLSASFVQRYSKYRRHMVLVGWPLCLISLVAGSFANTLGALIFTQGVMYSVGFMIFYCPLLTYVNEFWVARRGLAYGLLCAASGMSGVVFPFIIDALLNRYGYKTTLRAIAVGVLILTAPFYPLMKGRLPQSEVSMNAKVDWSFLRKPLFWLYSLANLTMSLGFFFPTLYLPSYAQAHGISSTSSALLLSIMSCTQVIGQLMFGYLSDKEALINPLAAISTAVAAIAAYACWNLAHTFPIMVIFALLYGFFGAGYTALWGRMGTKVSSQPSGAFMAFAMFNFEKGIGNVLAGPISGALLTRASLMGLSGSSVYHSIILFTGTSMAVSGATIVMWHLWSATLGSKA